MSNLTQLELLRLHRRIEHWLRFGRPVAEAGVDQHRRILSFAPGNVFAVLRWAATDLGTGVSRIDILRVSAPGERCSTVPHVRPGAEILLRQSGWPKVERVLQAIDAVLAFGIDPADAAPDHWRHVNNRLTAGFAPRAYSRERHPAWHRRRRIEA
ncbi:hypothetical protein QFZ27_001791 [Inquilinus ginsengisoli]|uniref:DUF2840 domain-containing protein n=1 Tax=Inquilinus ginsengisoli TaxID=363840 RepID=UPI003D1E92AC